MAFPSLPLDPWPPRAGVTSMIVPRDETIFAIHASARVAAPAELVGKILIDTSAYPRWNTFCPRVTIHSQPSKIPSERRHILNVDTSFTFHVVMDSSKPNSVTDTRLRMTDFSSSLEQSCYIPRHILNHDGTWFKNQSRAFRFAWTTEGRFVSMGLKSERWHEIIQLNENECEVRTWECQGGPLARLVKFRYKDVLQRKFEQWCQDLKTESEKTFQEREK